MTNQEFEVAIKALIQGDISALRQIYEAYIKLIYLTVYNVVANKEDAEDITSEFFVKLIRVAGQFKSGNPHRAWLCQIAHNMALDHLRKNGRELPFSSYEDAEEDDSGTVEKLEYENAGNKSDIAETAVLAHDLKQAMKTLKPQEKSVVDLKLIGELKFKEISEILKVPIGTVSWLYNQGIIKLRRYLKDYE